MEKIKSHIVTLILFSTIVWQGNAQEWISSLQVGLEQKTINIDTSNTVYPSIVFPSNVYENSFQLKNTSASGRTISFGFGNDISFNKNIITTSIGVSFHSYEYGLLISQTDSISQYSRDSSVTTDSDQSFWNTILNEETNQFNISKTYPSLRLSIGYKRELFRFKSFVPMVAAGLNLERRFNLKNEDSIVLEGSYPYVTTIIQNQFNHKQFTANPYIGFSLRFGPNTISANYGFSLMRIDDKKGVMNFKESYLSINYAKILGLAKITKEQVIYNEYQHLGLSRSSEYRRGDKFSYINIGFDHEKFKSYDLSSPQIKEGVFNGDSLTITTKGNTVAPSANFGLAFNTFATHRWMVGLGIDIYQESYNSYGDVYDSSSTTTYEFAQTEKPSIANSIYSDYSRSSKITPFLNTAIYVSQSILKIDPFVKASAGMVMNYDVPVFLKSDADWRSTSFFPIYKLGAGFDVRLRIKSSRFIIIGFSADYNINPHTNYLQYNLRMGYYRKKKLKNQRY